MARNLTIFYPYNKQKEKECHVIQHTHGGTLNWCNKLFTITEK